MRYFHLPTSLLLAVCASSAAAAAVTSGHRVLHAATKRSDLHKRETKITPKFESEVVYVEEVDGWRGQETFASSVRVGSERPILNLEEIEHLLQDVECRDKKMMLHFVDALSARDARAACHGGHGGMGGLIITSHPSCNRDGERAVYKIDDVSFAKEGVALDLAVTESLWQDAFDNMDINFGHTRYDHIYRRHSNFLRARKKRQLDLQSWIPKNASGNATDVKFDLTSEVLDKTFTAAEFLSGIESVVDLPMVPDLPIEIGCKNCSTRGQIVVTQGAIKIDTKQIDLVPDFLDGGDDGKSLTKILKGGYMDLAVKGLGARLEMFARPVRSGSYEIALFPLPVLGFTIPGIGQAGASFEPKISVDFEIDREIALNYGIDVTIPDGAGIKVELGDLAKTAITGMKGATLNALPFTTNISDADVALSVAFTPSIPIGFEFSDKLSALVTVALDLPRLDARLTTNAKDQCSQLDKSKQPKADEKSKPKDADLSNLVLVEANISAVVGVGADLTLPLLPAPFDSAGTSTTIFSTEMPLMTSCINPVNGELKITQMAPIATIKADKAEVTPAAGSTCTKHEQDKPCNCATVTTTVYAVPPTGAPPVTGTDYGASPPPGETPPPFEMTPYYPETPTVPANPPANPENPSPPVETPTGGSEQPPYSPDSPNNPTYPPPGGYGNGTGEQQPPTTSTPCTTNSTIRITLSTAPPSINTPPPAGQPPVIIISAPASKPCNSSGPAGPSPPSTATDINTAPVTDGGNADPTPPAQPPSTNSQTGAQDPPETEATSGTQTDATQTDATQTDATQPPATSTLSTATATTHTGFEESKGFMGPPGTGTGGIATSSHTGIIQFTGGANPGYNVPSWNWGMWWQIGLAGASYVVGSLII